MAMSFSKVSLSYISCISKRRMSTLCSAQSQSFCILGSPEGGVDEENRKKMRRRIRKVRRIGRGGGGGGIEEENRKKMWKTRMMMTRRGKMRRTGGR